MNIVSTMVGLSNAGIASPMLMDMSLAPVIAQKRATNFGIAESAAVTYAAANEQQTNLLPLPNNCAVTSGPRNIAHEIACTEAPDTKFTSVASRSFRLFDPNAQAPATAQRNYRWDPPDSFTGHQCPIGDEWGLGRPSSKGCTPIPVWSRAAFIESDPDTWLYDVTVLYGVHHDY